MKRLFVLVAIMGGSLLMACAGTTEKSSVSIQDQTGISATSILVGFSLDVLDPEVLANEIAEKYDGKVVGGIREVREYQIEFLVGQDELSDIRDAIGLEFGVSFIY